MPARLSDLLPDREALPFPFNVQLLEHRYVLWQQLRDKPASGSTADRQLYNQHVNVQYPSWSQAVDSAVSLLHNAKRDRVALMVEGPVQVGKTSFAIEVALRFQHEFRQLHGRVRHTPEADYDLTPVLLLKGTTSQAKGLMNNVMKAIGYPTGKTAQDDLNNFEKYCQQHDVRLLVIDDIGWSKGERRDPALVTFFKLLLDTHKCSVMFTSVDFKNSPVPRPEDAPAAIRDVVEQIWGRGVPFCFTRQDVNSLEGKRALVASLFAAQKSVALLRQDDSDLRQKDGAYAPEGAAAIAALLNRHQGVTGRMLSEFMLAAAEAVGSTERVGSSELGAGPGQMARRGVTI